MLRIKKQKRIIAYLSYTLAAVVGCVAILGVGITMNVKEVASRSVVVAPEPTQAPITYPATTPAALYRDPTSHTIAEQPVAKWFGGWNTDIQHDVADYVTAAAAAKAVPQLVLYNIPGRDCGSYSAGGSATHKDYAAWIEQVVKGIGDKKALVVLEPDAIAGSDCLSARNQSARFDAIKAAVTSLKTNPNTSVYIDGGNARWQKQAAMANLLIRAGIQSADGFALNVSNFVATPETITYGQKVSQLVNNKHFVIDTSRNGNGAAPNNEWCNPHGRALGQKPTLATNVASVDAYLWIKVPGESDGTCNGGPAAGVWWPAYADELARNTKN